MFEKMKEIVIGGKKYIISIHRVNSSDNCWYCAYVILKGKVLLKDPWAQLDCLTYFEGNVFGVDTNHAWNSSMDETQRYNDSIKQIKSLIKSYNNLS